ncbi:glycosyltransferase family 39 protein [Candidatus Sumerlaeota bacterium]|nr:glycosyltransferase family 39 protein [Candidatus Sumerlaeota bacterium]
MPSQSSRLTTPLVGVLLACAVAYGAGSARTGFYGKDELRYAQVAKEMRSFGDFFVLRYQGEIYPDKPPLYFWMARAGYLLTGGVSPFGTRLPLILTTLATVLLTFDIGRRLFGIRAGLLAALFYGLSFQVVWSVHATKLDPPLVLFTTLALWFWVRGVDAYESGRRPPFANVAGFWIAMGLGALAKGPLALIVPLGTLLTYYAVRRRWRGAIGWSTAVGIALFLAVVCVWLVPAYFYGREERYLGRIFGQEIVERSLQPWRHVKQGFENWVYFLEMIWHEFLPGSLLLPAVFVLAWRKRRERTEETRRLLFVVCWFLFFIVFMTLMKSKREQYILPVFPAAGLLVGWLVDRLLAGEKIARPWTAVPMRLLAAVGAVAAVAIQFDLPLFEDKFQVPMPLSARLTGLVVLGGIAAAILASDLRGRLRTSVGWSLVLIPAAMVVVQALYFPIGYDDRYYQDLAREAQSRVGEGGILFTPTKPDPYFNIYGDYYLRDVTKRSGLEFLGLDPKTKIPKDEVLETFLNDPRRLFMIMEKEQLDDYRAKYPSLSFHPVAEFQIPRYAEEGGACIVSNRPENAARPNPGEEEASDADTTGR